MLKNKNPQNYYITYLSATCMSLCLLLMVFTKNTYFIYAMFGIGILSIRQPVSILPVYFLSSLSTSYFAISDGYSAGRYLSILLIVSLLIHVLNNKRNKFINVTFICVVLILYDFLSAFFSITGNLDTSFLMLQNFIVLILLSYSSLDVRKILISYAITCLMACIVITLQFYQSGVIFLLENRLTIDDINSNRIAMMMAQVVGSISLPLFISKKKILKISSFSFICIAVYIMILTGSRSALIGVILSTIIIIVIYRKYNIKSILYTSIILFIAISFGDLMYNKNTILKDRYNYENIIETGGTGRLDKHKIIYKNIIPNYPLFGVGIGGKNIIAAGSKYGLDRPAHSIITDPLSQLGIIGFSLHLFLLILIIHRLMTRTYINDRWKSYACFILFLIMISCFNGIGETIFYEKFFWNNFALACLLINNSSKHESL